MFTQDHIYSVKQTKLSHVNNVLTLYLPNMKKMEKYCFKYLFAKPKQRFYQNRRKTGYCQGPCYLKILFLKGICS